MRFALERVTQPEIEPVTLAEAKLHLRAWAGTTEHDDMITKLITGAREWVEAYTGRALIDQTWRLSLAELGWPFPIPAVDSYTGVWIPGSGGIWLRKSPIIEIVSVASVDSAGVETAIDADGYEVREGGGKWPRLLGVGWTNLRITFRAGFANRAPDQGEPPADPPIDPEGAEKVPERFKQAIKLWVEAMYDRDEKMMPLLLQTAERVIVSERSELQVA